mgnify:CR=1 FL=1
MLPLANGGPSCLPASRTLFMGTLFVCRAQELGSVWCEEKVEVKMPHCGHTIRVPCSDAGKAKVRGRSQGESAARQAPEARRRHLPRKGSQLLHGRASSLSLGSAAAAHRRESTVHAPASPELCRPARRPSAAHALEVHPALRRAAGLRAPVQRHLRALPAGLGVPGAGAGCRGTAAAGHGAAGQQPDGASADGRQAAAAADSSRVPPRAVPAGLRPHAVLRARVRRGVPPRHQLPALPQAVRCAVQPQRVPEGLRRGLPAMRRALRVALQAPGGTSRQTGAFWLVRRDTALHCMCSAVPACLPADARSSNSNPLLTSCRSVAPAGLLPHALRCPLRAPAVRPALRPAPGLRLPVPERVRRAMPITPVLPQPRQPNHRGTCTGSTPHKKAQPAAAAPSLGARDCRNELPDCCLISAPSPPLLCCTGV